MVSWAHPTSHSKRHLDRLSRFCRAHQCAQTDIPCCVCSNSPHFMHSMRCGQIIYCSRIYMNIQEQSRSTYKCSIRFKLIVHWLSVKKKRSLITVLLRIYLVQKSWEDLCRFEIFRCWQLCRGPRSYWYDAVTVCYVGRIRLLNASLQNICLVYYFYHILDERKITEYLIRRKVTYKWNYGMPNIFLLWGYNLPCQSSKCIPVLLSLGHWMGKKFCLMWTFSVFALKLSVQSIIRCKHILIRKIF